MKKLMIGNEAIARGAYEAGVRVVCSYPGTPSTEITEFCAKYPEMNCQWGPNEKVSVEVAFGAAMTGARALSCMKHVGVNVAADPLFTAAYTGVNGGLVIACADDPFMHSSQNEQDSRMIARSAHIPMLEPADSQECKDFMKLAYQLSEEYDTPVFLRLTTRLAHSRSPVEVGDREEVGVKPYEKDTMKYVMMPGMARKRHVYVEEREKRMAKDACQMPINRMEIRDQKLGVVCAGVVYQYVREALPEASVLKLGLSYPMPDDLIREFAGKVEKLIVVEELEPVFENHIKALGLSVSGKDQTGLQGELSAAKIKQCFENGEEAPKEAQLPARPPVLCPGCPHRATFYTMKRLGLTVFGDIGCYTLCALPPVALMDSALCMGASVGMAHGAEKARGKEFSRKAVAVLGDSTFIHSGITPLIDAVYGGASTTTIILDNRITGMTGHQQNPATGKDILGDPAPQLNLEALCESIGAHVRVCDPHNLSEFNQVLKEELAADHVSVIIARRPCALLDKTKKETCYIDDCRNCGTCMKLGCPALQRKKNSVTIDHTLCVGCGLCKQVCPFKAIKGGQYE
ncbi:MAG: indolepyruvate ferredoxin oxidoreductase subunit alpha [Clostridia bacterium]|nr:indolepyruvate ferredoxin oxidoreductase subunit alpha [Clostridia bacterium]